MSLPSRGDATETDRSLGPWEPQGGQHQMGGIREGFLEEAAFAEP